MSLKQGGAIYEGLVYCGSQWGANPGYLNKIVGATYMRVRLICEDIQYFVHIVGLFFLFTMVVYTEGQTSMYRYLPFNMFIPGMRAFCWADRFMPAFSRAAGSIEGVCGNGVLAVEFPETEAHVYTITKHSTLLTPGSLSPT